MDNNFGFFNAKLYCEGALILVCVFVELYQRPLYQDVIGYRL